MLKGIIVTFGCFILFLLIHVIVFHNWKKHHRFRTLVLIWTGLLPVYVVAYFLIDCFGSANIIGFLNGALIYLFLFFGYCQFYFMVDRSVSTRMMIEMENSLEKKLTFEEIKRVYDMGDKIFRELKDLLNTKFIIEDSGYYCTTKKGRYYTRIMKFLKGYLNLGRGG